MVERCRICGLEIESMDRMSGRVVSYRGGEAHSYCRVIKAGVVPDCPLADNVTPRPCTNQCLQAKNCPNAPECGCCCENLVCQIGQSVRVLRARGEVPWHGYVPKGEES